MSIRKVLSMVWMKEQRAALMAAERANQAQIEAARQQGTNAAAMSIGYQMMMGR